MTVRKAIDSSSEKLRMIEVISRNPSVILLLVAIVFGSSVKKIYEDLQTRNEVLIQLIHEQVQESKSVTSALNALSTQIERKSLTK